MKKRIGKVVASALTLALCLSLCTGALAYSGQAINAVKAPDGVVVDGKLDEWDTSSPMTANAKEQVVRDVGQWTGPEDCSLELYAMWDEENLYLAAKVLDDTPFMYREVFRRTWRSSSMVICLSTDAAADPARTAYTATDWRVTQIIDNYDFCNGIDRDMIEDNKGFETVGDDGDMQVLDGGECAAAEIEGGYTFECKIPLADLANENIPQLKPEAGMTVGFECGMFDLDFPCPGVATVRIESAASEDVDTNPSLWGTLTFMDK